MISPESKKLHRGWAVFLGICLLGAAGIFSGCDEDDDFIFDPLGEDPLPVRYYGIWGTGPNDIFVVGQPGVILHSADNGANWDEMDSHTTEPLVDVWGTSPTNVYACGHNGKILHYDGSSWSSMSSGTSENLYDIGEFEDGEIYVCGYHGEVRRLSGNSWTGTDEELNLRNENLDYLRPAPRDTILSLTTINTYAFGGFESMLIMTDPEHGWELRNAPGGEAWISGGHSDPSELENNYFVTDNGKFFRLTESNIEPDPTADPIWRKSWIELNEITDEVAVYGMWASVGDTTFHATRHGHIVMMMPDDGTELLDPTTIYPAEGMPPSRPTLFDLTGFSTDDIFAVGENATILHGSATGAWESVGPPVDSTGQFIDKSAQFLDKFAPTGK